MWIKWYKRKDLSRKPQTKMSASPKFRFQNQRALLTYRTHLNKEEYCHHIARITRIEPAFIRLAHETGDEECQYLHTHVVVDFGKNFQTTNERFFDYTLTDGSVIHPHIKVLKNRTALKDASKYIAKEDPENSDLANTTNVIDVIQGANSLNEAFQLTIGEGAYKISSAMAIKTVFDAKKPDLLRRPPYSPTLEWQVDFINEMMHEPDFRSIIWYYDTIGNNHKTQLAKYMMRMDPIKWYVVKDMGTSRDSSTIIANAIVAGWQGYGIIIDLPRTAENHTRMYTYIEEIKDGFITAQKYSGRTIIFDNPHVVVMANWLPLTECLSLDRWDIRHLNSGVCTSRTVAGVQVSSGTHDDPHRLELKETEEQPTNDYVVIPTVEPPNSVIRPWTPVIHIPTPKIEFSNKSMNSPNHASGHSDIASNISGPSILGTHTRSLVPETNINTSLSPVKSPPKTALLTSPKNTKYPNILPVRPSLQLSKKKK